MTIRLLDIHEAAAVLHTTPATLRFWRHKGEGPPAAVLGRRLMYREADCAAWVEAQFAAARPPGAQHEPT